MYNGIERCSIDVKQCMAMRKIELRKKSKINYWREQQLISLAPMIKLLKQFFRIVVVLVNYYKLHSQLRCKNTQYINAKNRIGFSILKNTLFINEILYYFFAIKVKKSISFKSVAFLQLRSVRTSVHLERIAFFVNIDILESISNFAW